MNKKPLLKFIVVLTLVTLLLFWVYTVLVNSGLVPKATYPLEIFLMQYIVMLLIYFLLLKAISLKAQYFVQIAIFSIVAKLLLYGIFNFIVIYLAPEAAYQNVILFLSIYLIFTPLALGMLCPVINSREKNRHNPIKRR